MMNVQLSSESGAPGSIVGAPGTRCIHQRTLSSVFGTSRGAQRAASSSRNVHLPSTKNRFITRRLPRPFGCVAGTGAGSPLPSTQQLEVPHRGYHWHGSTRYRRYFEGWYFRIVLPQLTDSFEWIHAIEDPAGDSKWSKVSSQALGVGNRYLLQTTPYVSQFWGDRHSMHISGNYSTPVGHHPGKTDEQEGIARRLKRVSAFTSVDESLYPLGSSSSDSSSSISSSDRSSDASFSSISSLSSASVVSLDSITEWSVHETKGVHDKANIPGDPELPVGNRTVQDIKVEEAAGRSSNVHALPQDRYDEVVEFGFQATDTTHRGCLEANHSAALDGWEGAHNSFRTLRWDYTVQPVWGWGGAADRRSDNKFSMGPAIATAPILEPQWQIIMAHGWATGWIEWEDADGNTDRHEFSHVPAYCEKNWGDGFPKRYFWLQCNAFEGHPNLTITIAGAKRRLVQPISREEDIALVGLHLEDGTFVEVLPWNGEVSWEVAPWGAWRVAARTGSYEILYECFSEDPGVLLRGPDEHRGFVPLVREGAHGEVRLRVWKRAHRPGALGAIKDLLAGRPSGKELLVDAVSDFGACEVGGGPWEQPWNVTVNLQHIVADTLKKPVDLAAHKPPTEPMGQPAE